MDRPEPIYLDYHSTTPCDPEVWDAMMPYFTEIFGNASSQEHAGGNRAKEAVEVARMQVAQLIHAKPEEIVFTSSTTESNHACILGAVMAYNDGSRNIISAGTEHASVLGPLGMLEGKGHSVTRLSVDDAGRIDLTELENAITPKTVLITLMHGNNEIGTIHPIGEVAKIAEKHGILFHTDAAQTIGREPIDVGAMPIDMISLSSHKIYGPKGVAAFYLRSKKPRIKLSPLMVGGGQERGVRPSTLNVPGIVGMGKAYQIASDTFHETNARTKKYRDDFQRQVLSALPDIRVHGYAQAKLSHNWSAHVSGIGRARDFLKLLPTLSLSTGSSCSSNALEPSHVLLNIGLSEQQALSTFRFSFGKRLTEEEVSIAGRIFIEKVIDARKSGKYAD